jgi:hypothetical protein
MKSEAFLQEVLLIFKKFIYGFGGNSKRGNQVLDGHFANAMLKKAGKRYFDDFLSHGDGK